MALKIVILWKTYQEQFLMIICLCSKVMKINLFVNTWWQWTHVFDLKSFNLVELSYIDKIHKSTWYFSVYFMRFSKFGFLYWQDYLLYWLRKEDSTNWPCFSFRKEKTLKSPKNFIVIFSTRLISLKIWLTNHILTQTKNE